MVEIRSATINTINSANTTMSKSMKDINAIANSIYTGKKADSYVQVDEKGSLREYLDYSNINSDIKNRLSTNKLLSSKISEMESSLRQMQGLVKDALVLRLQAADPNQGRVLDSASQAKSILAKIQNQLNKQFNGKYLFGGTNVNSQPAADIVNQSNLDVNNDPTANYYLGNNDIQEQRISENNVLSYGINANSKGFQDLIAGLNNIIAGNSNSSLYLKSDSQLRAAQKEIGDLVAIIGTNSKAVSDQISSDEDLKLSLEEKISEIKYTDIVRASQELNQAQALLRASFMATSKIVGFSLVDYLK